jgi:hypothetical protein
VPYPLYLERDGAVLLAPYCPPQYPSMEAAVYAFVESKFGARGASVSGWRDPQGAAEISPPSEAAIEANVAYCEYVHARYGRFPAYAAPFRTVLGYQATHVDVDFYDRFYRPEVLTQTQHRHLDVWHGFVSDGDEGRTVARGPSDEPGRAPYHP